MASQEDLLGQVLDGRYRVEAFLARGGMATVYRATDLRLDRVVALKVMHPHLASDPDFVARFQREAKAAARLSHPHVVGVFDQGDDGQHVYLAMEYVPGRTLRDVMREYGPLTTEQALVIIEPVLEALQAAHAAGFVHRDIKPENVLIADDGRVKVADFGLARALTTSDASQTQGVIMGTVAYLAPEQVERGDADERTDLYATGVVLFEMITGTVPYDGESPIAVAFKHVHEDVPVPSSVKSDVPTEADALVHAATRRDPSRRYQSAREFLADTKRVRGGLPRPRPFVESRDTLVVETGAPQTMSVHQPAPPRRRRTGLWVGLAVLIAAGAAAFAGWYLAIGPGNQIPTPNVVSLTVPEAQETLAQVDLTLVVAGQTYSETVPVDAIVSTDPQAADGIRPGGSVDAIVSLGPERYDVPAVKGQTPAEAEAAIAAAKLTVGASITVFDTKVPEGTVAGTTPKAGASVKPGTTVELQISKGPAPVPVPDVVGARVNAAKRALTAVDLKSTTTERFSEKVADGRVISVKPKVGNVIAAGSAVELVVSKGPPPVTVPNLIDMPRARAVATLEGLGLRARVDAGSFTRLNRVIDQSPAAGSKVPRGTRVTIRII